MRILATWALALAIVATPAAAEIDLAATLALPVASGLVGAEKAARFAWVENAAGVRNLWVAAPGRPAARLTAFTADDGLQIYDQTLSADGSTIAYVRGGDGEFADGNLPNPGLATAPPPQQLFVVATGGGAPTLIGEGHGPVFNPAGDAIAFTRKGGVWLWRQGGGEARRIATLPGSVGQMRWSPDGTRLLFAEDRDDHDLIGLLDIAAGTLAYLDPALGHATDPTFSPDGRAVAYIRYVSPPAGASAESGPYWSIRTVDLASGAARTAWAAPQGPGGRFAASRGGNLFWVGDTLLFPWERTGWLHAYAVPAGGTGTARELTPGAFEVESFLPEPGGRTLIYTANGDTADGRELWRRPMATGTATRLASGKAMLFYPAIAAGQVAALATDATHPAHPMLIGRTATPLAAVSEATGFVVPEAVVFRAADGVEVHAQLFRARTPGPHPALIFAHGGPRRQMLLGFHTSGYYSNAYVMNQHLASQGYDVLAVNYRSGTGYGLAFRDAGAQARDGASEYRDILAAGQWLAARPHVDPARIGIWGGSWGGYLAALALARNSELFAAGVDFHGVHTMLRPVDNNLSPDQQTAARQLQWTSSPMGAIERWRSPVLLIHGDDDHNVDFSQSVLLARELSARRIPYEELMFPNERHGFFRYADWLRAYRATDDFLRRRLMEKR